MPKARRIFQDHTEHYDSKIASKRPRRKSKHKQKSYSREMQRRNAPIPFLLLTLWNMTFREKQIAVMLAHQNLLVIHPASQQSGCFYFTYISDLIKGGGGSINKITSDNCGCQSSTTSYTSATTLTLFLPLCALKLWGCCHETVPHLPSSSCSIRNPTVFQVCWAGNESW